MQPRVSLIPPLPLSLQDLQFIYITALKESKFIQEQLNFMLELLDARQKPSGLVSVRFNRYESFFCSFLDHLKYNVTPLCVDESFPIAQHPALHRIIEIEYKFSGVAHPIDEEEIVPLLEVLDKVISSLEEVIDEIEKTKLKSVFLSHSFKDKSFVHRLASDLIHYGAKVWLDEAELKVGDSLIQKIQEGIKDSDYLGVVLSSTSVQSRWVQDELDMALTMQIHRGEVKVLPILIEHCEIPGFLIGKLYADFTDPRKYDEALAKLLDALKQ